MSTPAEENKTAVEASLQSHGKVSVNHFLTSDFLNLIINFKYYHADNKLPKESQELLKNQELIGGNDDPKFLGKSDVKKMVRSVEINKYDFMNDGVWIKYIIFKNIQ